jgi:hypothetical protein
MRLDEKEKRREEKRREEKRRFYTNPYKFDS